MATTTITIRTDAKLNKKISAIAEAMDRSRNWVIEAAIKRYIEEEEAEVQAVKEAIASLDRGEGIPHEQVMADMDELLAEYGVPRYGHKK